MRPTWVCTSVDQAHLTRIAELIALKVRAGDLITLTGDLGAGKTTFARALIRALLDDPDAEVPSPTFTIVQSYATPRIEVAHFDLYRLNSPDELDEVGFDDAIATGLALVEWPERAGDRLHGASLDVALAAGPSAETRTVTLTPDGAWAARLERLREIDGFLANTTGDAALSPGRRLNARLCAAHRRWRRARAHGQPADAGRPADPRRPALQPHRPSRRGRDRVSCRWPTRSRPAASSCRRCAPSTTSAACC